MSPLRLGLALIFIFTTTQAWGPIGNLIRIGLQKLETGVINILLPGTKATTAQELINGLYVGSIKVGNDQIQVLFDTGSSLMWITSGLCKFTNNNAACGRNRKYNGLLSRSHTRLGAEISKENVSGFLSQDVVHVEGLKVYGQTFLEATSISDDGIRADGVVGLGFSHVEAGLVSPLFFSMVDQGIVSEPVFSLHHKPTGGQILFGGHDPALFQGEITYVNTTKGPKWEFIVDRVELVGADLLCRNSCHAHISTRTSGILIPASDLLALNKRLSATDYKNGMYQVNCGFVSQLPDMSFVAGNNSYTLHAKDYVVQIRVGPEEQLCLSVFQAGKVEDEWVLGTSFLERFYSVFDIGNSRIGFASSK